MVNKEFEKELFKRELETLETVNAQLKDPKYTDNELFGKYKELAESYRKLLNVTRKVFKISDVQGRELKRREYVIKNLLDNSKQGFLTFGKDLLIDREYSAECVRIFKRKVANVNIVELLSEDNHEQKELLTQGLDNIFKNDDPDIRFSYIKELPGILKVGESFISIKYKIIRHSETGTDDDVMMLVLTDITDKAKAEDHMLYLSYHDKLTSLYNRAYVDSVMPQLQSSGSLPLSIVIADMNGLKLTNDVFGHEKGDALLVRLSNVLLRCCRKDDIIARWGGDEFIIFLQRANQEVCERVCARIKKMCGEVEADPIELSVSLGYATMENSESGISEVFNMAENMMYGNKLTESKSIRKRIILSMGKILQTKGSEYYEHTERIKGIAFNFAKLLNFDPDSLEMLNLPLLAEIHDIGKVAIPKEIIGKPGPLTESEWKIMQSHAEIGFRMAQSIEEPFLAQALISIREKWDGTGYPYGLKYEQIPLISRIISIADAYDAMTHDRPYKKGMSREEAMAELKRCSGTQFDPNLVELFLKNADYIAG